MYIDCFFLRRKLSCLNLLDIIFLIIKVFLSKASWSILVSFNVMNACLITGAVAFNESDTESLLVGTVLQAITLASFSSIIVSNKFSQYFNKALSFGKKTCATA